MTRNNTEGPADLDGLLDITLIGGAGADKLTVDFGGPAAFDTMHITDPNRGLRLRVLGGDGADTVNVSLTNDSSADFNYDVQVQGGNGNDNITFFGSNDGGTPTFNPIGVVLIDGGLGFDTSAITGNFPTRQRNFEA
jgi:hypothetical protein